MINEFLDGMGPHNCVGPQQQQFQQQSLSQQQQSSSEQKSPTKSWGFETPINDRFKQCGCPTWKNPCPCEIAYS